jgi:general secretion pathway protein A
MYLDYYNLIKEPFHITPDPEFLFLSESHKQALAAIIYATEQKKGFVAITGGVGVGKTTILRAYLEKMDSSHTKTIYLFNPNVSFKSLINTIYKELGIKPEKDELEELVRQLHLILIEEYRAGRNIVLIIDEAQNMPIDTLENLRMLSNLETPTDKLIQMVMIGQPELDEILDRYELRQLKQRIAIRTTISPLTAKESYAYIKYRLQKAGLDDALADSVFTVSALQVIVKQSMGIPRTINVICDNCLITGFGNQEYPVTSKTVNEVISDLHVKKKHSLINWQYATAFSVVLLLLVFFISPYRMILMSRVTDIFEGAPEPSAIQMESQIKKEIVPVPKISEGNMTAAAPVNKEQAGPLTPVAGVVNVEPQIKKEQPAASAVPLPGIVSTEPRSKNENAPISKINEENAGQSIAIKKQAKKQPAAPVVRVVRPGDNLIKLIEDVYDIHDRKLILSRLISVVRQSNPKIKDMNNLPVGSKIVFPDISKIQIAGVRGRP